MGDQVREGLMVAQGHHRTSQYRALMAPPAPWSGAQTAARPPGSSSQTFHSLAV